MTVTIIPRELDTALIPTKERRVFLVSLNTQARYEVLRYSPETHELKLRREDGRIFMSHWNDSTKGKYAVEYRKRS